jgi:ProP effector
MEKGTRMSKKTSLKWRARVERIERIERTIGELSAAFPKAFFPKDSIHTKPLKTNIHVDVRRAMPEISGKHLSAVMNRYTKKSRYLRALSTHEHRVDLDGNICEEIALSHRMHAAEILMRRMLRRAFRQAA